MIYYCLIWVNLKEKLIRENKMRYSKIFNFKKIQADSILRSSEENSIFVRLFKPKQTQANHEILKYFKKESNLLYCHSIVTNKIPFDLQPNPTSSNLLNPLVKK